MRFRKGVERGHQQGERARQDFVSDWKPERVPHRTSAKENQDRRAGNAASGAPRVNGQPFEARHYCRNPRCRTKLKVPVSNRRDAFCTRGCFDVKQPRFAGVPRFEIELLLRDTQLKTEDALAKYCLPDPDLDADAIVDVLLDAETESV